MKQEYVYDRIEKYYREHNDRLVGYCNKYLNNYTRAEDCVQDAYVRALTYWNSLDSDEKFEGWFHTILHNCIRENWKVEMYHGMNTEDERKMDEQMVKPAAIPAVIYEQVVERIDKKSPEHSKVLTLFLLEQYKPKEIEEVTGVKANNVRQIVHNFRQEIRQEFRWTI